MRDSDRFLVETVRVLGGECEVEPPPVLLLDGDLGGLLVEPDPNTLELMLNLLLLQKTNTSKGGDNRDKWGVCDRWEKNLGECHHGRVSTWETFNMGQRLLSTHLFFFVLFLFFFALDLCLLH